MRVTVTKLRKAGHLLPVESREPMLGQMYTRQVKGAKVLEFEPVANSLPGEHGLFEAKVKKVPKGTSIAVYAGSANENGAWVCQEWEIDFSPVGSGWLKSQPRYPSGPRIR